VRWIVDIYGPTEITVIATRQRAHPGAAMLVPDVTTLIDALPPTVSGKIDYA
jgi:acyl-coenzyme A synthetase/AMP-(fatty) acid ligase